MSAASTIDFYRRPLQAGRRPMRTTCGSRKGATAFWGLFASVTALYAANLGSLIEVVNRFGSFFYGSLLGVFVLAVGMRRVNGRAARSGG